MLPAGGRARAAGGSRERDDVMSSGGLASGLDDGERRDRLGWSDGRWCDATQRVDHTFVESSIGTGFGRDQREVVIGPKAAPLRFEIVAKSREVRQLAFAQLRFLRIHSPFYKGGSGAEHAESRTALRGKGAHE